MVGKNTKGNERTFKTLYLCKIRLKKKKRSGVHQQGLTQRRKAAKNSVEVTMVTVKKHVF